MGVLSITYPDKFAPIVLEPKRYKVAHGGRGSAKSHSFAKLAVVRASREKIRILCVRETQNSIKDSVHKLLKEKIYELGLNKFFHITETSIKSWTGAEFIFKGLRGNVDDIKSTEGVDICWVEEAESATEDSWKILIPTIRKELSEIWVSFNPEAEKSPTYQRFVKSPPPNAIVIEMNWRDNPWFPEVLRVEMERDKLVDFDTYEWIWEGKVKKYSQDVIFRDRLEVTDFETPQGVQLYFGADFGFSVDPNVLVRCFIKDQCLWIDHELYGVGIELEELEAGWDSVPGARRWKIRADCERPDTISFMKGKKFDVIACEKGPGSVEDGIVWLRKFKKIYIHTRCAGAKKDFENYRWKRDRVTNDILPIPLDKFNHVPDAIRYALEPMIKKKVSGFDVV